MLRSFRALATPVVLLLAGCMQNSCDEFAAPSDRVPAHCPPKSTASQAVRPDPGQPLPTAPRYCYSSLGQEECYDKPQPGHETGYLGTYAPTPPPEAKPPTPPGASPPAP